GKANDAGQGGNRHEDDEDVSEDDEPTDAQAHHGSHDAQNHDQAHGPSDEESEGEGVDLPPAHRLGLLGHGEERRLGDHGGGPEEEAERQERRQRALPRELGRQALAEREDAEVQPLEEDRDPEGDDEHPDDQRAEVLGGLSDDEDLERG